MIMSDYGTRNKEIRELLEQMKKTLLKLGLSPYEGAVAGPNDRHIPIEQLDALDALYNHVKEILSEFY